MKPRRRPLLWICCLVAAPLVMLGVPAAVASWGGEIYHLEDVVHAQAGGPEVLFGSAYSSPDVSLKLQRTLSDAPDVLVIGSSRTLDIRREFIKPEYSFYNAGRIAADIWVVRQALMKLEKPPTHLIVGLDQFRFNSAGTDYDPALITPSVVENRFAWEEEGWNRFSSVWMDVNSDILEGKIGPDRNPDPCKTIGLSARLRGNGFRNDGSYRYGTIIDIPVEKRPTARIMGEAIERAAESKGSFEHGDTLNPHSVEEVGRLLDWCLERKIKIIAYLPAYAPSVIGAMRRPPSKHTYLEKITPALEPVFHSRGLKLFDFSSPEGTTDAQFIDGFHSSERVVAGILLKMAEEDPTAAEIINRDKIRDLLAASKDPLVLVP